MMTHNDRLAKADEKGGAEFYFSYVLQFDDGTFYVGHTNAPAARRSEHAAGLSTATADRGTFRVRMALPFGTRKEAHYNEERIQASLRDRRQLVLPVATTIFAGRYGVIIRYGGTVDYRPTSQAIEAETYGRQDTGNGSGQGWDERAFSAQVAAWPIAVGDETGASVAHLAGSLRRGVGG